MDNSLGKLIGQRINNLLARDNIKQKELAKVIGVPDNTVSYFCSGKRIPNTEQIRKIAQYFNTSTDYLLGLTCSYSSDIDERFVSDYTGLKDESVDFLNTSLTRIIHNMLDFLISGNGADDFFDMCIYFEEYKKSYQNLINHKKYVIENCISLPIDSDKANIIIRDSDELADTNDLCEFKIQKGIKNLLTQYCSEEVEKDMEIKVEYQKLYEYLKYTNIYELCERNFKATKSEKDKTSETRQTV